MLFATQSTSVGGTQKYFDTVLTQGDYYLGQEIAGHWRGRGAKLLGLEEGSRVTKEQFSRLLAGTHPLTGDRLTQRMRKDRRPGMDLTFSVPKSVSLAWAVGNDERMLDLLREAVHETMQFDVEPLMQHRVRKGQYANTRRKQATGKLIYADFLHKTSRPVDGAPDPHLHIHAFVMNWTEEGGQHYAGEMEEIVRQRPALQAKFDARLATKLQALGYPVEQVRYVQSGRLKKGWEIAGVSRATIEKFSRRTAQIEQQASDQGIEDAEQKGRLGLLTRESKNPGAAVAELQAEWRDRLAPEEREVFTRLGSQNAEVQAEQTRESEAERAAKSVQYALDHYLYRQSTVERHQLAAAALEHGITLRPESIERAIDAMRLVERKVTIDGTERRMVTTRAVLEAERRMIAYAREGRGACKAIRNRPYTFSRDWLNDQQQAAVQHILESRDSVVAVIGGAGTGKTSLMQEAAEAVRKHGKEVHTFAPSTGAKEVLQEKGFQTAQTVEHLIRNTRRHAELAGQVLWIDEAGLVDVRSMNKIFDIAREQNARVVLSGDPRQHSSPRRGEAMRLLDNEAGLKMARVEKIQRQQGEYQRAVEFISRGHDVVDPQSGRTGLLTGFDMLDAMGKVKEISTEERHAKLAETYLGAIEKGKSSLVVAPTHVEAQAVTAEIRRELQQQEKLSREERAITQYRSLHLSEAEKSQPRTYAEQPGLIVQFHQNAKGGFQRGDRYRVVGAMDGGVELTALSGGAAKRLPLDTPGRFEVYSEGQLKIAPGDKVRFSLGGVTKHGDGRISNGRLDEVKGFNRQGDLVLKNNWVVSKNYAHVDLGYVVTSHASQGKDRDVAIGAMGSESLGAINAKQFYVTVSRGREDVVLYVDDKQRVRKAIQRSGEQLSATEMVADTCAETTAAENRRDRQQAPIRKKHSRTSRVMSWWREFGREWSEGRPLTSLEQALSTQSMSLGAAVPSPDRSMR